ncbi:sodium-dependent bicarbonate transport family permease [Turneriella parva]|uniref:Sodium-dependent bicarbonate transporter n=1 Tax=Turneriella parva (strain ATCC BAA-1111 / DSM 21527 / NCTC 11395 / H) TaxID=869212 RepID=I4B4W5_TURPD|nr:sodium-dependent bicarbonate transport family permease [Turneriella parva]AFM12322.1 protein of unknown function DUF897 [Turneriella parva DSM 21527]
MKYDSCNIQHFTGFFVDVLAALLQNLQTPMILAFFLGIVATAIRSDLKFSDGMYAGLTIYLLFAIGLKGGYKLSQTTFADLWAPALAAVGLCIAIPIIAFWLLRKFGKFSAINAAAIAAHYGSVSAVTFGEAQAFLDLQKIAYEGYMPGLLAIMEIPAILIALFLVKTQAGSRVTFRTVLHDLFAGKGTVLLLGGLIIGAVSGKKGFEQYAPLFDVPFRGVLILFLLAVGITTGKRLNDLRHAGLFLVIFAILFPVCCAAFALPLAKWAGLSLGGAMVFASLAASASYIAAPTAIRIALPEASPAYYLTAALVITFPFNITIGLPLYLAGAQALFGA